MLSSFLQRIRALFHRSQQAEDLADELLFHHSSLQDKLVEEGLSPEQATIKARRQIGDVARWQERLAEQWQFSLLETLRREIGFSLRQLRKTPGFTLTVVLTLAIGIGATTAIFSLIEGVLLRPLPFPKANELVLVGDHVGNNSSISVTVREIEPYTRSTQSFSSLGGYATTSYEFSNGQPPEQINVARFTSGVFPTLGVQPVLGRVFTTTEENTRQPLAVLSYSLWQDRFGGNPKLLGEKINLNRKPYTIIGVMPRSFEYPLQTGHLGQARLWVPLSLTPGELSDQQAGRWGAHIVARLRHDVTTSAAALDADRSRSRSCVTFP